MFGTLPVVDLCTALFAVAADSQAVIALRVAALASGRSSPDEVMRMHAEKVSALCEAQGAAVAAAMSGRPERAALAALAVYGRAARANRRRLVRRRRRG